MRTLPSEYFASSFFTASSMASLMAMPREPGESGCFLQDVAPGLREVGRARVDLGAVGLHHDAPVGFLIVADAHHVDRAVEAHHAAGEGERRSPTGPRRSRWSGA